MRQCGEPQRKGNGLEELGNRFGVAILALLGALLVRRFQVPGRLVPLVPIVLAVIIVWAFEGAFSAQDLLSRGLVSGLLASGLLHIVLGGK